MGSSLCRKPKQNRWCAEVSGGKTGLQRRRPTATLPAMVHSAYSPSVWIQTSFCLNPPHEVAQRTPLHMCALEPKNPRAPTKPKEVFQENSGTFFQKEWKTEIGINCCIPFLSSTAGGISWPFCCFFFQSAVRSLGATDQRGCSLTAMRKAKGRALF